MFFILYTICVLHGTLMEALPDAVLRFLVPLVRTAFDCPVYPAASLLASLADP